MDPTSIVKAVVVSVAAATVLGGGSMVLEAHEVNAVQDEKIEQQKRDTAEALGQMRRLEDKLEENTRAVDELSGVLRGEDRERSRK